MRLNHYLMEDIDEKLFNFKDHPMLYEIIKKECSEIIKVYKNTNLLLYRGIKKLSYDTDEVQKIRPRTDRRPVDTSQVIQERMDDYLYKKFHWKPRSEGVFASANLSTAKSYSTSGFVYIIFPVNGFKYLWSPEVEDAYEDIARHVVDYSYMDSLGDDWYSEYGPETKKGKWESYDVYGKSVKKLEDLEGFINVGNITKTSNTFSEVTIDAVVALKDEEGKLYTQEWNWIPDVSLYDYTEMYAEIRYLDTYQDDNIEKCLQTKNEIMIKCKYYYAIRTKNRRDINSLGL